jgi:hypothetical protein
MDLLDHALRGSASGPARPVAVASAVVVAGAAGVLGSAVLELLLAQRCFRHVRVLVSQGFHATVHGLEPVVMETLDGTTDELSSRAASAAASARPSVAAGVPVTRPVLADTALVVFDRERHANGRDAAFFRPTPEQLPAMARWLQRRGVRHLIVVLPHQAALLPQALKVGLVNLDEQAVAAMGFEHVVIVRSAEPPAERITSRGLQRVADMVLAQLRFMTPQQQQPVRARKVAALAAALAHQLRGSAPGTRVLPPEVVWHAAQLREPHGLVQAWLAGEALPAIGIKVPRM